MNVGRSHLLPDSLTHTFNLNTHTRSVKLAIRNVNTITLQQLVHLIHGVLILVENSNLNKNVLCQHLLLAKTCNWRCKCNNMAILVYLILEHPNPNRYWQFEYNSYTPATTVLKKYESSLSQLLMSLRRDRSRPAADVVAPRQIQTSY